MTTRQKIDSAHEARMWLGQVLIPLAGIAITTDVLYHDQVVGFKERVKERVKHTKLYKRIKGS